MKAIVVSVTRGPQSSAAVARFLYALVDLSACKRERGFQFDIAGKRLPQFGVQELIKAVSLALRQSVVLIPQVDVIRKPAIWWLTSCVGHADTMP